MNPEIPKGPKTRTKQQNEQVSVATLLETHQNINKKKFEAYKDVLLNKKQKEEFITQKLTIENLAFLQTEQLRSKTTVNESIQQARKVSENADAEQQQSIETAEKKANRALKALGGKNKVEQIVQNTTQETKDKAKKVAKEAMEKQSWELFKKIPTILILFFTLQWGKIGSVLSNIFKPEEIVKETAKNAAKTATDTAKDTIGNLQNNSPVFDETKKEIITTITTKIGKNKYFKHPALNQKLEAAINNPDLLSTEKLQELQKKYETGGKLIPADLRSILGEAEYNKLLSSVLDKEAEAIITEQVKTELLQKIYTEYHIDGTTPEKKKKAYEIVSKFFADSKLTANKEVMEKLLNEEVVHLDDILAAAGKTGWNFAGLILSLTTAGVISARNIFLNISEGSGKMLKLSLPFIPGVEGDTTTEDLYKEIEKMDDTERNFLLATLYRKSGVLANIIGDFVGFSLRSLTNLASSTSKSSLTMGRDALFARHKDTIKTFTELEKKLGSGEGKKLLSTSKQWVNSVTTNHEVIHALEGVDDLKTAKSKLSGLTRKGIDTSDISKMTKMVDNAENMKDLRKKIADHMGGKVNKDIFSIKKNIFFNAREFDFYQNMKTINKYQMRSVQRGILNSSLKGIGKFSEILAHMNVQRSAQGLIFEANSAKGALSRMDALRKLCQEAPDLARSLFRGAPTIAFIGLDLSMNKDPDKSTFSKVAESALYMSNIIGPIKLIANSGVSIKNGDIQWHQMAEAGIGTVLLGMDMKNILQIAGGRGDWKTKGLKLAGYPLRPVTDVAKIGFHLGKTAINISDLVKSLDWKKLKSILKGGGNVLENIPKRKVTSLASVFAIVGLIGYETLIASNPEKIIQDLQAKGIVDKDGNMLPEKVKSMSHALSPKQKSLIAQSVFEDNSTLGATGAVDAKYEGGKIKVYALQKHIGEWIIQQEGIVEGLLTYFPIDFDDIQFIPHPDSPQAIVT